MGPYVKGRQETQSEREVGSETREAAALLDVMVEEGATRQGIKQPLSRSWKSQGYRFLPRASRRNVGQLAS